MNSADVSTTNTAAHTADTPQLLLEHHLKELRLPDFGILKWPTMGV
jgi:hypothetical protein